VRREAPEGVNSLLKSAPIILWLVASILSARCEATECVEMAERLQLHDFTISNDTQFQQYAQQFCSEYAANHGASSSSGFSLGYSGLSIGLTGADATQDSVYQKNCSGSTYTGNSSAAFQHYFSKYDPQAYEVLQACENMKQRGIEFDVPPGSLMKKDLIATVLVNAQMNARPELSITTSADVSCTTSKRSLTFTNSITVHCTRPDNNRVSAVSLAVSNAPVKSLLISWDKMDDDGVPERLFKKLNALVDLATRDSVVAFSTTQCPAGWKEFELGRGRFLRGIDPTGSKAIDTDGKRLPLTVQGDMAGPHKHRYDDVFFSETSAAGPGISTTAVPGGLGAGAYDHDNVGYQMSRETSTNVETETRPKNVAVTFCTRAN
jgi:hypothetical protein